MAQSTVNIKKGMNKIFILVFMAYAVSYIGRKGYSACMSEICTNLAMTKTFSGTVSTGYLACYGAGQLISGILGDRISPKYMITIGLIGAGLSNIAMGLSNSPYMLLIFWCLNGLFNSMLWSPVIRAISDWIPDEGKTKAGTNISATIPVGTVISYFVSWFCLKYFNWHITFFVCGSLLIITGIIWYFGILSSIAYIKEITKKTVKATEKTAENTVIPSKITLVTCIVSTGLILTVIGILFNGIIKDGVTEWVPTYITEYFKVSPSTASLSAVILPIVNLSGAYIAKWINDKFTHNEMGTSAVLFGVCTLSITLLFFFGKLNLILAVMLIAISTSSMLGVNNMFLTFIPLHFSKVGKSSSVTGFLNSCSYIAAALSTVIIGTIAQNKGWSITVLFWLAISLAGIFTCIIGIGVWNKGRKKIEKYYD